MWLCTVIQNVHFYIPLNSDNFVMLLAGRTRGLKLPIILEFPLPALSPFPPYFPELHARSPNPFTSFNYCFKVRIFDLQCWPTLLVYWEESFASEVAFPSQTWSNCSMPTRWVADLAQIALITVLLPSSIDHNLQTDESDHCAKRTLWTLLNTNSSLFVRLDNQLKHLLGEMLRNRDITNNTDIQ